MPSSTVYIIYLQAVNYYTLERPGPCHYPGRGQKLPELPDFIQINKHQSVCECVCVWVCECVSVCVCVWVNHLHLHFWDSSRFTRTPQDEKGGKGGGPSCTCDCDCALLYVSQGFTRNSTGLAVNDLVSTCFIYTKSTKFTISLLHQVYFMQI